MESFAPEARHAYHPLRQSSGARVTGIVLRLGRLAISDMCIGPNSQPLTRLRLNLHLFLVVREIIGSRPTAYIAERTDPDGSITSCNHLNCVWTCVPNFGNILELVLSD